MSWDDVFDVVVIGSGIAGVSTALAAREVGLRPILLEKAEKLGGGTSFSMGGIWIGNNHLARAAGYRDSRDDVLAYMRFVAADEADEDADLPKDEAGRRKIKRQYLDLLGIRIEKLKGRILNRERINKTIDGIYFICAKCLKVCHSLDDGLIEDSNNQNNQCGKCGKARTVAA